MLVYTTMALIGGRSKRAGWLTFFIVCDVLFVGVDIAIITVLARAGLPASCVGFSMVTPDCMKPSFLIDSTSLILFPRPLRLQPRRAGYGLYNYWF